MVFYVIPKNCFPVFKQVIIVIKNFKIELFFLEKGNVTIKKQTISGLFNSKTKFDSKMTGEKELTIF